LVILYQYACWMNSKVRAYAADSSMLRPELVEIKNTIKTLRKDAEMRLTLDVEAQQSFEFLSDQVHGLRRAFSALSDVLIEEVDLIRSEANTRHEEMQQRLLVQAKALKMAKTELTLLRNESQTGRASLLAKSTALEERMDAMQEDSAALAKETTKCSSAIHLLQLEVVELRAKHEEEARERRAAQEITDARISELADKLSQQSKDARASVQALDADLVTHRTGCEQQFTAHSAAIDQCKAKLLQCAQAIEKQWSTGKVQQQRIESLSSSGALHNQQLQERLETFSKQQSRMRASTDEAIKVLTSDLKAATAHCNSFEAAIASCRNDTRRLMSEHEGETQRQCDTLGRAIHSLADTLHLTSPLIVGSPTRERKA